MRGFTLIELIVVIGIITTLLAVTFPSLIASQHRTSLSETVAVLVSDIKQQQTKAMLGNAENGLYFQADQYVLFTGSAYSAGDPANFAVILDPSIRFSDIPFPASRIIFSKGSGQASGFISDSYDLTVSDQSEGVTRIITINNYGVITEVN